MILSRDVDVQGYVYTEQAITGSCIPHHLERSKDKELVKQSLLQPSPNARPQGCLRDPGCFFYPPLIPEDVSVFQESDAHPDFMEGMESLHGMGNILRFK